MWSPPPLPDAPSPPSTDALLGAPPRGATTFIRGEQPTAICNDSRPELPLEEIAVGSAALSNGGWSVNCHFLCLAAAPPALSHGGLFKRYRATSLSPFQTVVTGPAARSNGGSRLLLMKFETVIYFRKTVETNVKKSFFSKIRNEQLSGRVGCVGLQKDIWASIGP
jgi:hypothetical protein